MDASFYGLSVLGIASAVPENTRTLADETASFSLEELNKTAASIGVQTRHVSSVLCTSDLCYAAAAELFTALEIKKDSIDALIFITQTPDYILPATSCGLQARLGLSKNCVAFDVNLGCSGYVYGLWLASTLLSNPATKRVLLLVGDTISRVSSPLDKSVLPLFGDAGTATIIERHNTKNNPWFFSLGTNGAGQENLMIKAGGFRYPFSAENQIRHLQKDGNTRSEADLYMNGGEIFTFTLQEVPKLVEAILQQAKWTPSDVDAFIFHQANRFMLEHLRKRLNIPPERFILALEKFGNTSSASIPLAMSTENAYIIQSCRQIVLVGFGVGYSWGAAAIHLDDDICLPKVVLVS